MKNLGTVEVLLVEDNPADVELITRALEANKYIHAVHTVTDGEAALDFIFARGRYSERKTIGLPKVIFLDLKLPKIDGVDVLREIREDPRTKNMRVVVLTSSKEERDVVETYKLDVDRYIVKPVDNDELVQALSGSGLYWLFTHELPDAEGNDQV